jgi:hypothetical protein
MILEDNIQETVRFRVAHAVRINVFNELDYKFWALQTGKIEKNIIRDSLSRSDITIPLDEYFSEYTY